MENVSSQENKKSLCCQSRAHCTWSIDGKVGRHINLDRIDVALLICMRCRGHPRNVNYRKTQTLSGLIINASIGSPRIYQGYARHGRGNRFPLGQQPLPHVFFYGYGYLKNGSPQHESDLGR